MIDNDAGVKLEIVETLVRFEKKVKQVIRVI